MPSKSKKSSGGKLGKGEDFTEIPLNDIVVKTGNVSALDDDVPYLQDRIEGLPDGLQAYKPRSGLRKYKKTAKSFIPYRKKTKNVECARIDSAGCFSVITYSWLSALIYRMWKSNDVKQSDLYTCSIYDNTNSNTVRLEHRWNGEVARVGPQKASLARAVWAFCRTRILVGQAFFILCCIVGFFGPAIFVRKILEYAETKGMNSTVGRGITLVVGLTACEVVRSLMFAATWAVNLRTGARIRAGILGLVFEKILRLRTLGDKSAGEFVNLFANDGIRIFEGVTLGPLVVGGPLVVMMGLAYVVWLLGGWGAIGMLVFVFFYFIQMIIAKIAVYLRRKSIVATDKRVRLMTEVLTYVKLIKMYAWERSFAKAVSGLRVTERNWLQRAAYLQSMAVGLTPIVPMAAAVVTFISHTLSGNDLTVSQAFTVVAVYNTMRFSISILIYSARCSAEMIVSFRRIKAFTVLCVLHATRLAIAVIPYSFRALSEMTVAFKRGQAFTVVTIFNTMRFSIAILPFAVRCVAEMNVSINRIQAFATMTVFGISAFGVRLISLGPKCFGDFWGSLGRFQTILLMEEVTHKVVKPSKPELALEIKNATFSWDAPTSVGPSSVANCEANGKASGGKSPNKEKYGKAKSKKGAPVDVVDEEEEELQQAATMEVKQVEALQNIDLQVEKGRLIGICGSVGSGKSSLLSAVLGQMRMNDGTLGIDGRFAYVAQQAWIINASVRENITFGADFDSKRYYEAIYASCLNTDIAMLANGDETEVGERGVNLSGGQKQRISLARAFYTNSDIYLLDDPLSSVDTRVGQHIFKHLIRGSLKGKTILFVTHQLQYLSQVDEVLLMKEGSVLERGTHHQLVKDDGEYSALIKTFHMGNRSNEAEEDIDDLSDIRSRTSSVASVHSVGKEQKQYAPEDGKLMTEEESGTGSVKWVTYKSYIAAAGGCCVLFGVVTLFLIVVCTIGFSNIWLSYWLRAGSGGVNMTREVTDGNMTYEETYVSESIMDNPRVGFYQLVYGLSIIAMVTTACFRSVIFMKVSLIASSRLHDMLFIKVLRSPMRFFDSTPVGRIINRFSTDMDEIDVRLPYLSEMALINLLFIITTLFLIAAVFPWFLIGVIPLCLAFSIVMKCFQTSIRQLKRLENLTRSPLFSHVTSSVQGLATIHAYNKARDTITKFNSLLDDHTTTYFLFHCAARWLAVRLDVITLSATVTTALLCVLMVGDQGAAWSGLALTYAMTLSGMFQFTIRLLSEAESRFTCVERIHHYIQHLESESSTEVELLNHAEKSWPQNGSIRFQKVCLKYREGLPLVLKDLTLEIKAGEKIGICGRTGAGKSSLGTALFRLVELESGYISIDTVDISKVGLEDLRSRIAIIPQDPVLFAGTIRYNLDPFNSSDDESLWAALEKTHMKENIKNLELQLNAPVIENGENFSVGERQLVCMARALLRNNKVLMLDEATAAIDTETDAVIQATIKEAFAGCTLLTIAHRINTVLDYDRILVMSDGRVAEFDTPQTLLADKKSLFSSMVASADQQMRAQLPSSQISVSR